MSDTKAKPLFPVFLDLTGRLCIVIGDGERAERKARALVEAGGDVVVICASPSETLLESCTDGELTVEQRGYVRGDLENASLALCIGQPEDVARAIASEASERHCLLNATGLPDLCDFIIPSAVSRGDLQVALSTAGAAPAAARQARAVIEDALGEEWGAYVTLLGGLRALIAERHTDPARAAELLARAGDPAVRERIAAGEAIAPDALLRELETVDPDADPDAAESEDTP